MHHLIESFLESAKAFDENLYPFMANKKGFNPKKDSVYYSGPFWDDSEIIKIIYTILNGKWLSSGEEVNKFEREFSKKFNFRSSVMVNSGSSANLILLASLKKVLNWKDGDEIIVCACGFPTTIAPILQNNMTPVFVDIDWSDLNWNIDQLENKITPRTRAVFSSPVLGNPYDHDKVLDICKKNGIEFISDNCDSLGSKWRGKFLTDYAVAASCSFYPAHHLCTIEGGMVSSSNEDIINVARSLAWWGRDCTCVGVQNLLSNGCCGRRFDKWLDNYDGLVDHKYIFTNMGYNLKPLELQGAIGTVQLNKFEEIHSKRRNNKKIIGKIFSSLDGVRVIEEKEDAEASWFGVPVVCDSFELKQKLVAHLEENRIQTRNYFAGNILLHPAYSHLGDYSDYPCSNQVLNQVFFVGCSPTINEEMIKYIREVINNYTVNDKENS